MKQIDVIVNICVRKGYVPRDDAPWLKYALEKKTASLMAFVPLIIIGVVITNAATLFAFITTFCVLRARTNGFHAASVSKCIIYSILGEVIFLKFLPMIWNDIIGSLALIVSIMLIWFFAPYNHPNMGLSPEEMAACAKSAKLRLSVLMISLPGLCKWSQYDLALGIALGIIMAAVTLVMAYCSRKVPQNAQI